MSLAHLYPVPEKVFVQCAATVNPPAHSPQWRRARYAIMHPDMNPDHCMRASKYSIDGTPYCAVHAAQIALQRWLDGRLLEKGADAS